MQVINKIPWNEGHITVWIITLCYFNQWWKESIHNRLLGISYKINVWCISKNYITLLFHSIPVISLCTGVQSAAVNVICELARKNPKNYLALAPLFFKLMTSSTNNWVLIKIIKLVSTQLPWNFSQNYQTAILTTNSSQ